jgi:ABC-2 type transport system permease protein
MTFLQQTLGRNYKWWYYFRYSAIRILNYKLNIFSYRVGEVFEAIFTVIIWQNVLIGKTGESASQLVTYFIIGWIISQISRTLIFNNLPNNIADGSITTHLMCPQNMIQVILTRGFGTSFTTGGLTILAFPVLVIPFWNMLIWNTNLLQIVSIIGIIGISMFIRSFSQIISSSIAFWTPEYQGTITTSELITKILSGALVPLYLLGDFSFIQYLPFSFGFYHPMQIYLGKYSQIEILQTFAGGIIWCLVLWILARLVFKAGLKRNEAVGL